MTRKLTEILVNLGIYFDNFSFMVMNMHESFDILVCCGLCWKSVMIWWLTAAAQSKILIFISISHLRSEGFTFTFMHVADTQKYKHLK